MKKFNFILLSFSFLFLGCTAMEDDINKSDNNSQRVLDRIGMDEAIDIADKVLNKNTSTRALDKAQVNFDFVISSEKQKTRGAFASDTLAYIINYPNDEGFVIVSSNRGIFPVLGFSDKGHFSYLNENAKINFIDKIEEYTYISH